MTHLKWLLFSGEGRLGRKWFWYGHIIMLALLLLLQIIVKGAAWVGLAGETAFYVTAAISTILWLAAGAALAAKRAHDRAKSTAYGVGLFGASALTTALGGTLQTINADSARDLILTSIAGILPLWYFIEFGFFSGSQGSNAYGDDPRNDPWQN